MRTFHPIGLDIKNLKSVHRSACLYPVIVHMVQLAPCCYVSQHHALLIAPRWPAGCPLLGMRMHNRCMKHSGSTCRNSPSVCGLFPDCGYVPDCCCNPTSAHCYCNSCGYVFLLLQSNLVLQTGHLFGRLISSSCPADDNLHPTACTKSSLHLCVLFRLRIHVRPRPRSQLDVRYRPQLHARHRLWFLLCREVLYRHRIHERTTRRVHSAPCVHQSPRPRLCGQKFCKHANLLRWSCEMRCDGTHAATAHPVGARPGLEVLQLAGTKAATATTI